MWVGPHSFFITRCILESNGYPAHQHGSPALTVTIEKLVQGGRGVAWLTHQDILCP